MVVDDSYVKVAGRWRYLYRAVDQYGQVIDVLLTEHRAAAAAGRFFVRALCHGPAPVEVTTDKAPAYLRVLDELVPAALHVTEQYANNAVEADHGRLKARLRPMRGLKRFRSAAVIAAGHAFVSVMPESYVATRKNEEGGGHQPRQLLHGHPPAKDRSDCLRWTTPMDHHQMHVSCPSDGL